MNLTKFRDLTEFLEWFSQLETTPADPLAAWAVACGLSPRRNDSWGVSNVYMLLTLHVALDTGQSKIQSLSPWQIRLQTHLSTDGDRKHPKLLDYLERLRDRELDPQFKLI